MSRAPVNRIHRVEVVDVSRLTPGMVRVVFGGDGLDGFVSTGVGDEYLRLFLPSDGHDEPVLPEPTDDGYWAFPDGVDTTEARTYTVRSWDAEADRLTIDLVVHDGGVAAAWALGAAPGHVAGVNTPHALYAPPEGIRWQLLVADSAGLPAALRLAELAPRGVRTRAILEVPGPEDEQHIDAPDGVELTWLHGGNGHGASRLEDVVRSTTLPDGLGYVWVAGEARVTRSIRRYLRHELSLPATAYKVVGYWTENVEQWIERYEALPEELRTRLQQMWADETRDIEDVEDEYEATLEAHGL